MFRSKTSIASILLLVVGAFAVSVGPALAGGGGCLGTSPSDGSSTTVELKDICFTPTVTHVASGSTVTWVNRDDVEHIIVGVGETWGTTESLSYGEKTTYRFDGNGVYVYACWIHPGMVGAVVVGDPSGPADLTKVASVVAPPSAPPAGPVSQPVALEASDGSVPASLVAGAVGLVMGAVAAAAALTRRKRPVVA